MTEQRLHMVVTAIEPVNASTARITLALPDGGDLPAWEPGAHVDLHLPAPGGEIVRQHSLCGDVADRGRYRVAVLRAEESRGGSAFVHGGLRVGDGLEVTGPRNHFPLRPAARYLFIAGGIGITPILPMIRAAEAAGADWRLLFCARSRVTMPFVEALVARGGARVGLQESRIDGRPDLASLIQATSAATEVYCCGPEPMIREVEAIGERLGGERVHVERFSPRALPDTGQDAAFEVEFAQSGEVVTIEPGQSILGVAEELGIDIDSSCQEGTCGSCETRVISGVPDHRDSVLTAKERAENQTMMVCVSRARCARLVLDA